MINLISVLESVMCMKKGFTLIELLAVIIILAIVALIATPIVLDVVNDAKDSAAKSEASMIVSGVNNYCAAADMKEQLTGETNICEDGVTPEEVSTMVDLGNAKVNSITFDGKVTSLEVESNDRTVKYNGSTYTIDGEAVDIPEEPSEPETAAPTGPFYAFGLPTTSSSTDYQSVITESGSNVIAKLENGQLSVCMFINETLECFKNNNYAEESVHLQNVLGAACNVTVDSNDDNIVFCLGTDFTSNVTETAGTVTCRDNVNSHSCYLESDNNLTCE